MSKIISVLKKYVFKADRINFFFITNTLIAILLVLFLYVRFKTIWLMIIFSSIIFFVRWKRQTMGIHLTLEPVILFGVLMLKIAGLKEAMIIVSIPTILSDIMSGKFRTGTFISIFCKFLTFYAISYFPYYSLMLVTIISYIIFNEGIGTILALNSGCPIDEVLTQVLTSTVIRLVYLNLFLNLLCGLLGVTC
ncbi:MAG: hypothetical protein V1859_04455 [archaeon]